jgi:hypothetical protein
MTGDYYGMYVVYAAMDAGLTAEEKDPEN